MPATWDVKCTWAVQGYTMHQGVEHFGIITVKAPDADAACMIAQRMHLLHKITICEHRSGTTGKIES